MTMLNANFLEKLRNGYTIAGLSIATYVIGENTMMGGNFDTNDASLTTVAIGALLISDTITTNLGRMKDS